jgi:hypothetical protein
MVRQTDEIVIMGFIPVHDHFWEVVAVAPVRMGVGVSFKPFEIVCVFLRFYVQARE